MKKPLLLLVLLALTISAGAQTPYEVFGHKGKTLETTLEKGGGIIELINTDTTSDVGRLLFDFKNMQYTAYGRDNCEIARGEILPTVSKRWWSRDPKAAKYPGHSPYNSLMSNPIINVDPDGQENITIIGNQGRGKGKKEEPNSDFVNKDPDQGYKYGKNRRHFLEAGLKEALRQKNNNTQNGEGTTLIVYQGDYTDDEIEYYRNQAESNGIRYIVVTDEDEIINYINEKALFSFGFVTGGERDDDLITDFSYIGHGDPDAMLVGHNYAWFGGDWISPHELDIDAFDENSQIWINGCRSGLGEMYKWFKTFTNGNVIGYNLRVYWGEGGLGKWRKSTQDPNYPEKPADPKTKFVRKEKGKRRTWKIFGK